MMEKRPLFRFTLVELLVVISVIAILAALLLPALKSAKDKAVGIRCMSQMKQINPGIVMYTSDNDGFLPIYLRTLVATNAYSSAGGLPDVLLEPYLKQAQRGSELNTDYFGRIKHIRFRNFYTCPAVNSIHDTPKTIEYTGRVRVFSNYSPSVMYEAATFSGPHGGWFDVNGSTYTFKRIQQIFAGTVLFAETIYEKMEADVVSPVVFRPVVNNLNYSATMKLDSNHALNFIHAGYTASLCMVDGSMRSMRFRPGLEQFERSLKPRN